MFTKTLILILGIIKGVLFYLIGANFSKLFVYASTDLQEFWAYFGFRHSIEQSNYVTMTPFDLISTLFIVVGIIEIIKAVVQYVKDLQ